MLPPRTNRPEFAFSLPEVLIAIGLIAVALMALIGHSTVLMGAAQKGEDTSIAGSVAKSHLDRIAQEVLLDQPAGRRETVWNQNASAPFETTTEKIGPTEYTVDIIVSNIVNTNTGLPLGTSAQNPKTRLKQVEAVVTWWDSKTQDHAGYGKQELRAARLVKVTHEAAP